MSLEQAEAGAGPLVLGLTPNEASFMHTDSCLSNGVLPSPASLPSSPSPSTSTTHLRNAFISLPQPSLVTLTPRLYISHFLSTWNSRLFEFGAVLFLAAVYPGTLLPLSLYALARGIAATLLSPSLGVVIDTYDRLRVVRASIIIQRLSVAVSCAGFYILYTIRSPPSELLAVHGLLRIRSDTFLHHPIQHAIFGAVTFLGCAEKLAATLNTVAVERDWVVALTHNDAHARTQLNRRMRQIDLFCKLLGPLVIALIDSADTRAAISVACGMSLVSAGPEYVFIEQIYNCVPALQRLSPNSTEGEETPDSASWNLGGARNAAWVALVRPLRTLPEYVRHPAFQPSFALALLYLTVLSFSGQMVAFLRAAGFSSAQIGAARVVSSLFELSATVMAPRLVEAIGPVRAGIWALSWQTVWLGIGLSCFFWHIGNQSSEILSGGVVGLVGGVMVSRVGLWGYDFAAQTIIQNEVDEFQRGSFSAMEASIQNLFELLAFATTAIFHRPEQFRILTLISFGAVATASLLYAGFVKQRRGHLFHAPACLKGQQRGSRYQLVNRA
ncbi:Solute carrier family 40 member 1 [Ceratocystis fimbriata CBS 114723]|uniref:Solute carrier family 40 member n=1 Tax=Ceratocystis fimbriata CBS 114723 TaxID=1035309 RepID=A0A2C5X374_9PEZI|nr:Solute carrier family 40 member 1 [Ceratocystis fimbriata CBS 114723]